MKALILLAVLLLAGCRGGVASITVSGEFQGVEVAANYTTKGGMR